MTRSNAPDRPPLPTHNALQGRRRPSMRLPSFATPSNQRTPRPPTVRRASLSEYTSEPKAQRTSKTSQKLVVLPSAPQTKLLDEHEDDLVLGYETEQGIREYKSAAERMTKEQREKAGFKRITAYCVSEAFKMRLLASFLKREHNVTPRVFDEALYVMYYLPLLPGYGPDANVRSSAPPAPVAEGTSYLSALSEAEEDGYQGMYFAPHVSQSSTIQDGYISSPTEARNSSFSTPEIAVDETREDEPSALSEHEAWTDTEVLNLKRRSEKEPEQQIGPSSMPPEDEVAEVIFFEYGVVVFFGLTERQEKDIIEDIANAGSMKRKFKEDDWEIEECHFAHDTHIAYPRIYNDFFTLKSRSHLLKLSIAHALAQSTLLAHFETISQQVLSSPATLSIPRQLAESGGLKLRRREALKLTGGLFKLRRDINLVSNVLDVPELFWSEASLKDLYDAIREYMEIGPRVQVLNEKLGMTSDFLDAIHDHLNSSAMDRITWIVIWLIVVAILVELGEVLARLIVHAALGENKMYSVPDSLLSAPISREEALRTLERIMLK